MRIVLPWLRVAVAKQQSQPVIADGRGRFAGLVHLEPHAFEQALELFVIKKRDDEFARPL